MTLLTVDKETIYCMVYILSILSKTSLKTPNGLPEAESRKTDKAIVQKKKDKNINNDL